VSAWFGESWDAPVNDGPHVPTPVGKLCLWCTEAIEEGDAGVLLGALLKVGEPSQAEHRDCFIRSIVGSVGHLSGHCSCHGGNHGDPEGMTVREAASAVANDLWRLREPT
jgi:hypothetical protein